MDLCWNALINSSFSLFVEWEGVAMFGRLITCYMVGVPKHPADIKSSLPSPFLQVSCLKLVQTRVMFLCGHKQIFVTEWRQKRLDVQRLLTACSAGNGVPIFEL